MTSHCSLTQLADPFPIISGQQRRLQWRTIGSEWFAFQSLNGLHPLQTDGALKFKIDLFS